MSILQRQQDKRCSFCGAFMTRKSHSLTPNEGFYYECTNPKHRERVEKMKQGAVVSVKKTRKTD